VFVAGFDVLVGIDSAGFSFRLDLDPQQEKRATRPAGVEAMKFWDKLQNPFALVAQGFAVGGVLFWTTQAEAATRLATLAF